jgi:polyhydroxyalkanoate synthase subunit PhaC
MLRRGPRPLLLHLTLAMLKSRGSPSGSTGSNASLPDPVKASLVAMMGMPLLGLPLLEILAGAQSPGQSGNPAEWPESLRSDAELIAGIAAYRRHPFRRDGTEPPVLWTEGETRLLDYGAFGPAGGAGMAVLFVPSLVNRAYVLDLTPDHSMLRFLAAAGIRPLLLDWGWPGVVERGFTLSDYIAGRLERALLETNRLAGSPPVLAGYCMGGTLAVAAAARRPDLVRALALLAAPWDFHADGGKAETEVARLLPMLEPLLEFNATLPIDALQTLFTMLDPFGVGEKYRAFAKLDPDSERARLFVALEDWLNDGVPLAAPVARECLAGWYGANMPCRGEWLVEGEAVDPSRLRLPAFVVAPERDRIVPPESARPLAQRIRGAILHSPNAGHIGMTAGMGAEKSLWRPLLDWLRRA